MAARLISWLRVYPYSILAVALAVVILVITLGSALGAVSLWPEFGMASIFGDQEIEIDISRPDIILQVQSLARLETSQFTIEKVVEAEKGGNALGSLLFGDRLLLIAHGYVIGGVDLSKLDARDVQVEDSQSVWIVLPPSEIFVTALNEQETEVFDREKGWLTRGDDQLESAARRTAEQLIRDAACEGGILDHAAANAELQMKALINLLGFDDVTIVSSAGECADSSGLSHPTPDGR